jgi:hypothetical protein
VVEAATCHEPPCHRSRYESLLGQPKSPSQLQVAQRTGKENVHVFESLSCQPVEYFSDGVVVGTDDSDKENKAGSVEPQGEFGQSFVAHIPNKHFLQLVALHEHLLVLDDQVDLAQVLGGGGQLYRILERRFQKD